MNILLGILVVAIIVFFILGIATREDGFFIVALGAVIAVFFTVVGGTIMQQEIRRDAIKTGNAYYKQIVDKDGNVKNEFHWAKEPEIKTDCKCAACQKKIN